jgi:protein-L-isoaspartate O-methyltransferase
MWNASASIPPQVFVVGDGREGIPESAPFDCIHVGAASPDDPRQLMQQLKVRGSKVKRGSHHRSTASYTSMRPQLGQGHQLHHTVSDTNSHW